jgi:hypothetical protein
VNDFGGHFRFGIEGSCGGESDAVALAEVKMERMCEWSVRRSAAVLAQKVFQARKKITPPLGVAPPAMSARDDVPQCRLPLSPQQRRKRAREPGIGERQHLCRVSDVRDSSFD